MAASPAATFIQLPSPNEPNHAVYGALLRPGLLERFGAYGNSIFASDVYRSGSRGSDGEGGGQRANKPVQIVYFDCLIGPRLTGHDGIVHGGILALLFDEACGWGYEGLTYGWGKLGSSDQPGMTANLSVNFKLPLKAGTPCVMRVYLERVEGRKLFFRATLEGATGEEVYADASCLMVALRSRL